LSPSLAHPIKGVGLGASLVSTYVGAYGSISEFVTRLAGVNSGPASTVFGLCALLFGAGAVASAALVNLWRQAPSRRGLVLRRHSQSKLVGMMERLVSILWAIATTTAVIGSWATVVPLAAVAGVLALNRKWAAQASPARA